jgi:hypothetical protein
MAAPSAASAASVVSPTQKAINAQIAKYGGRQVSPYEVAYQGGNVVMVFPDTSGKVPNNPSARAEFADSAVSPASAALDTHGCPSGWTQKWYCVYQDRDFGGRMLEFKDCGPSGNPAYNYLSDYGFAYQTSSWVNTKTDTSVNVYQGYTYLWSESPNSLSSWVGSANNDRATELLGFCPPV